MTDILIRDLPDEVIDALDARARQLGLSRSEYVRRLLTQDAQTSTSTVDVKDLRRFSQVFADLADPDIRAQAWR
jgi:plasmid stability protein